jgi:hypothetical protein
MTFSGDYPCSICKALAEKRSTEQQKSLALEKYDKKFVTLATVSLAPPASAVRRYPVLSSALSFRLDAPPVPPPRPVLS